MKILAVDLGRVRTGIAISDDTGLIATPIGTITQRDTETLIDQVASIAKKKCGGNCCWTPRNMDGTRGDSARFSEEFAKALGEKTGLPVRLWDERMTTMSAIGILNKTNTRGKNAKRLSIRLPPQSYCRIILIH